MKTVIKSSVKQKDKVMKIGDKVNYHSIIGGPVSTRGHIIEDIEYAPNNYGCDVAWISDKRGCVAMRALSLDDQQSERR